jgi:hypothetical protein
MIVFFIRSSRLKIPIRHLFTAAAERDAPRRNSRQHDSAKSLARPVWALVPVPVAVAVEIAGMVPLNRPRLVLVGRTADAVGPG